MSNKQTHDIIKDYIISSATQPEYSATNEPSTFSYFTVEVTNDSKPEIHVTGKCAVSMIKSVFGYKVRTVFPYNNDYNSYRPLDSVVGVRYNKNGLIYIPLFDKHEIARGFLVIGFDNKISPQGYVLMQCASVNRTYLLNPYY